MWHFKENAIKNLTIAMSILQDANKFKLTN